MKIKRQELLNELYQFALDGNGLVVGIPGIGKSYLLRQLKDVLVDNDILCFIIKIDNAYDSSDDAIAAELGIEGNWIETLSNIELRNENKAVLIFDAFDAARDEGKRRGFLTQIRKAKALLRDKWHLIVSARTYDAKKSADLMKLFSPSSSGGGYSSARMLTIGKLKENEIKDASAFPNLYGFYLESTSELKEILHVPFFLKVLETILADYTNDNLEDIKRYKSETQLLDFFWQRKVDDTESALLTQQFLLWFTNKLVESKTLSIPKADLLQQGEQSQFKIFEYLRSELIIDEVSFKNTRIAYAHNIFFDYAVSRLCIDHNYKSLTDFISQDYSRAFFLRPSFVYFFTSVWYDDKGIFWNLYQQLIDNQQKEIQLFVRLIINSTIASQFTDIDELRVILDLNGSDKGNESIRNILQSIRFIRKRTLSQDVFLLSLLSKDLQLPYLFEFAFLLERAIKDVQNDLLSICGDSARNLLFYILQNRNTEARVFLDRIGSSRAVELVSRTFSTNPVQSREALRSIFPIINERGFEINYFSSLADDIQYFVDQDPQLVSEVYKLIFGYQETSDEKTQMNASVVMNFISNRRQDFEMCYFRLEQFFPNFLSSSPELAIVTGIEIVNNQVSGKRGHSEFENGFTFDYQGITCTFYPDYSSIWSDRQFQDKTEQIGEHITKYISELYTEDQKKQADSLVKTYIENAKVGFLWKLLMDLAAQHPLAMFDVIFPLIKVPRFFSSSEVSYEVRAFLEKVNSDLTSEQMHEIEDVIFEAYPIEREYGIQAALSILKPESLQTDRAKDFMATRETIANKRPVESSFSVTPYTTEERLKDLGVNVGDSEIAELTKSINYLDAFTNLFLNSTPTYREAKPHLDVAFDLWTKLEKKDDLPEELKYTLLNSIAKTAAISARDISELPKKDLDLLKKVISYAFSYVSKYDEQQQDSSPAHGYSPTPRIEATEALPLIYVHDEDTEFLELYKSAVTDQNSVVRYNAIKNLQYLFDKHFDTYRELLFNCLEDESEPFNYAALFSALYFKKGRIVEDGIEVVKLANRKTNFFEQQNPFVDAYAEVLLWFLNYPEMTIAFDTLTDGYRYSAFSNSVIFRLFKQIKTYERREIFVESIPAINAKLQVVENYIEQAGVQLTSAKDFSVHQPEVESALKTFDEIIMRIHFALESNQRISKNQKSPANENNRKDLYFITKPLIKQILYYSSQVGDKGIMLARTAHYLVQTLNSVIGYDAKEILSMVAAITRYSMQVGYTFDSYAIREIVSLTEKLLADHRELLLQDDAFQDLLSILEIHVNSGWIDALELLWKLDEVFK
ncbi:hypothetical protein [Sphingobacterium suaedae]|uniref:AAA+ ATPase domain-containing protein n=1 Tax=Sphingobacterium suaedae TaxID=1686402 RepID=A0ABW5KLT9_9SPHI